jgi:hypothetical protein
LLSPITVWVIEPTAIWISIILSSYTRYYSFTLPQRYCAINNQSLKGPFVQTLRPTVSTPPFPQRHSDGSSQPTQASSRGPWSNHWTAKNTKQKTKNSALFWLCLSVLGTRPLPREIAFSSGALVATGELKSRSVYGSGLERRGETVFELLFDFQSNQSRRGSFKIRTQFGPLHTRHNLLSEWT